MSHLDVMLWGSPRIQRDGCPIEVDTRKATALLAYLALHPESIRRDTLASFLWPEYDQTRARAALRRTLSVLHGAIDGPEQGWLQIEYEAIGLERGPGYTCDIDRFHSLVAEAKAHPHPGREACAGCLALLSEAVGLHRGAFMAGFSLRDSQDFDDWQFDQNEALNRELSGALERLVSGYGELGEFDEAITYAHQWLALDPLREEAHRALMRSYAWAGQRSAAIRQYLECERILEEELGVSPLEETTALYRAIVENRMTPPVQTPKPAPAAPAAETPAASPRQGENQAPLVGRSAETAALASSYQKIGPDGAFAALQGEAGIGKSRLAQEFIAAARSRGALAISGRCYEGQAGLAYAPVIDPLRAALAVPGARQRLETVLPHWLAVSSRLLPEIGALFPGLPLAAQPEGFTAQSQLFEALRQLVLSLTRGPTPGILFIDDAHWADPDTLELLAYLVRRLQGYPLLVMLAWRDGAFTSSGALQRIAAEGSRSGAGEVIHLPRLSPEQVTDLVRAALPAGSGETVPQGLAERLYQEAEGLPLFVVEYLSSLPGQVADLTAGEWPMPHGVRNLIQDRLSPVDEAGRQLLSAAAVIGRSFDFEILRAASGRSEEETVAGLESLLGLGLVREQPAGALREPSTAPVYDFSHEKLREAVYGEVTLARRRLLHRRVADALASHGETAPVAGQIAYHYRLAGSDAEAAEYSRRAGDYNRSIYANAQALADYQAALALGHPDARSLLESIGDLQVLAGEYHAAIDRYRAALAGNQPKNTARLWHKLGNVYDRLGEWETADQCYGAARDTLGEEADPASLSQLYADWSRAAYHQDRVGAAEELAEKALALADGVSERQALAQARNMLGIIARGRERFAEARRYLEESLKIAEESGNIDARIATLNNLALVSRDDGDIPRAISLTEMALDLCSQIGDRHRQAALYNNLADLMHSADQPDRSIEYLKKAVVIFAEIGSETGSLASEPWRLTEW